MAFTTAANEGRSAGCQAAPVVRVPGQSIQVRSWGSSSGGHAKPSAWVLVGLLIAAPESLLCAVSLMAGMGVPATVPEAPGLQNRPSQRSGGSAGGRGRPRLRRCGAQRIEVEGVTAIPKVFSLDSRPNGSADEIEEPGDVVNEPSCLVADAAVPPGGIRLPGDGLAARAARRIAELLMLASCGSLATDGGR